MTTLFDTSALIAVLNSREPYHEWSVSQLEMRKSEGPVVIVDIIYSELSVAMTKTQIDQAIALLSVERLANNDDALFWAGKAYGMYRSRGGVKSNVLPDFLIGAAAKSATIPLVTINPKDFAGYFPEVHVISPTKQ